MDPIAFGCSKSSGCVEGTQCMAAPLGEVLVCLPCRLGEYCPEGTYNPTGSFLNTACPTGSYCPRPWEKHKCPAGTFCPKGSVFPNNCTQVGSFCPESVGAPQPCPAGSYCPDSSEKITCPKGFFCRQGYIEPVPCPWLENCHEGSPTANGLNRLLAVSAIMVLFMLFFYLWHKYKLNEERTIKDKEKPKKFKMKSASKSRLLGSYHSVSGSISGSISGSASHLDISPSPLSESDEIWFESDSFMDVQFSNLSFSLKDGTVILDKVNGALPPRSLTAIMGPSGCGKTTLLNVLSGRATNGICSGEILVNGCPVSSLSQFRNYIGFVPQDDIVFEDLTVRENLMFSALLRLPKDWSFDRKDAIIQKTLELLDLGRIANSFVGSPENRGISGGQRKRVSIGMELVACPVMLFLDEPTSGLDSSASLRIVKCLKRMSQIGMTVVAVIHQPRFSVLNAFANVVLLGKGHVVYSGQVDTALEAFQSKGFTCPQFENPADFFLDVISVEANIPRLLAESKLEDDLADDVKSDPSIPRVSSKSPPSESGSSRKSGSRSPLQSERALPSVYNQFFLQLTRTLRRLLYGFRDVSFDVFIVFLSSLAVGLVYGSSWDLTRFPSVVQLSIVAMGVTSIVSSLKIFGNKSRLVFWRESAVGVSIAGFFYAKLVAQLYQVFLLPLAFVAILHPLLVPDVTYQDFYLQFVAVSWSISGVGMLMSVILEEQSLLASVLFAVTVGSFFSGLYPPLNSLNPFMKAISYLSYSRWATEALIILEDQAIPDHIDTHRLYQTGYSPSNFIVDNISLASWGLFFRFATLFALRFKRRSFDWIEWLNELKVWFALPFGVLGFFIPSCLFALSLHGWIFPIVRLSPEFWNIVSPFYAVGFVYLGLAFSTHYFTFFQKKNLQWDSSEFDDFLIEIDFAFKSRWWIAFQALSDLAIFVTMVLVAFKSFDFLSDTPFAFVMLPLAFGLVSKASGCFVLCYRIRKEIDPVSDERKMMKSFVYLACYGSFLSLCSISVLLIETRVVYTPFIATVLLMVYGVLPRTYTRVTRLIVLLPLFVSCLGLTIVMDFRVSSSWAAVMVQSIGLYVVFVALLILHAMWFAITSIFSLCFYGFTSNSIRLYA